MTIDINSLPIAAHANLQRVGQYLLLEGRCMRRVTAERVGILLAGMNHHWAYGLGEDGGLAPADWYRLLTEGQAIELARTMPHVDEAWRSSWSKTDDHVDAARYALGCATKGERVASIGTDWATVAIYEPATNIGELAAKKMAEVNPDIVPADFVPSKKPPLGPVPDYVVAARMETVNAEYAERQEAQKEQIKRDWLKVHSATTNGMCVMRGRR